ncbi:WAT1-related protein [Quillaja saponaria]|uniref:WAT1-related protein n=1 Tax=Quillaja saponaria TaxID=32244 RepID=A0AAD7VEU5_QUISA|nr:WAT1-related protein [Quillaja saponaria]
MAGGFIPFLVMVLVQVGFAGMNITSKLALQTGMNPIVLVAYRQLFAFLSIAPLACWMEWKTMPKMTWSIFFQIFLCSLTGHQNAGATGNQLFYFVGLKYSTPTIGCALTNTLPAFTFILAVFFRQESVRIKTRTGQAKVIGTIVGVGGAMLLSFYHGKTIGFGQSSIHWKYADKLEDSSSSTDDKANSILGPFFLIISSVSWATWLIIQAKVSKKFPAPYTSSAYLVLLGTIQCVVIALCFDHKPSAWSLSNPMRLTASIYSGVVCSGISFCIMSWTVQKRGPLYVSVFSPLLLVIVAFFSWALLREKLYIGTAIGSFLIVFGLYSVLWGKNNEMKLEDSVEETEDMKEINDEKKDVELQLPLPLPSNGNHHT